MKILVLVKDVPDTYGERRLEIETGLTDRTGETVLDEIDERALELALAHADGVPGTEVVALTMAPASAEANLRKALAMGAGAAVHVVSDSLVGADIGLTAEVLAAAARHVGFDLLVAGNQSTDGSSGMVPAAVAELLGVACATSLAEVEITETEVSGLRAGDGATTRVAAPLPAVISITEALPDARFPTFKGITTAKKKPIEVLTPDDLGVDAEDLTPSRSIMTAVAPRPPRSAGTKVVDDGAAADQLADFLLDRRLA